MVYEYVAKFCVLYYNSFMFTTVRQSTWSGSLFQPTNKICGHYDWGSYGFVPKNQWWNTTSRVEVCLYSYITNVTNYTCN